jgi:hypothetical protein
VYQILEVGDEWNILNAPCTEKDTNFFHYTSIFSEFTILVDKNPNGGYEGPNVV